MSETTVPNLMTTDEGYSTLEHLIRDRVAALANPLFETDATPEALWDAYLSNIPEPRRQHYNCHGCRRFIHRYGGLALVAEDGASLSALWGSQNVLEFFSASINALKSLVETSKVVGIFLASDNTWGKPKTGDWTHLSGIPATPFADRVKTAGQMMAEKLEDFKILVHSLSDYTADVLDQALKVLRAEAVYRSEKALGVAEWFAALHKRVDGVKGPRWGNLLWAAIAAAPPGFCHVRSTVISTLLDDIKAGLPFDAISKKWAEKLHPLQYQRQSAPPSAGAIEQAEKLVEKLGVAKSLERRFARLDDVLSKLWVPAPGEPETAKSGGVFDHLRTAKQKIMEVVLPPTVMTWEKFQRTILPSAREIEVDVPNHGPFYGLLTAAEPQAPPILQWDGLEGHPRNPVSCYCYIGGSDASQWNLNSGIWAKVNAVFLSPHAWQEPTKFSHQGQTAFFAIEGSRDRRGSECGLCLFPEILKAEFHGIRSVIEAHSRKGGMKNADEGNANGLMFTKGSGGSQLKVRVRAADGISTYSLDRWD